MRHSSLMAIKMRKRNFFSALTIPIIVDGLSRSVYPLFVILANGVYSVDLIARISVLLGFIPIAMNALSLGIIPQVLPALSSDPKKGLEMSMLAVLLAFFSIVIAFPAILILGFNIQSYFLYGAAFVVCIGAFECIYWVSMYANIRLKTIRIVLVASFLRSLPLLLLFPTVRGFSQSSELFSILLVISFVLAPLYAFKTSQVASFFGTASIARITIFFKSYVISPFSANLGFVLSAVIFPFSVSMTRLIASEKLSDQTFVNVQAVASFTYPFLAISSGIPLALAKLSALRKYKYRNLLFGCIIVSIVSAVACYFFADYVTSQNPLYKGLEVRTKIIRIASVGVCFANLYPAVSYLLCTIGRQFEVTICLVSGSLISIVIFWVGYTSSPEGMQVQLFSYYFVCTALLAFVWLITKHSERNGNYFFKQ